MKEEFNYKSAVVSINLADLAEVIHRKLFPGVPLGKVSGLKFEKGELLIKYDVRMAKAEWDPLCGQCKYESSSYKCSRENGVCSGDHSYEYELKLRSVREDVLKTLAV